MSLNLIDEDLNEASKEIRHTLKERGYDVDGFGITIDGVDGTYAWHDSVDDALEPAQNGNNLSSEILVVIDSPGSHNDQYKIFVNYDDRSGTFSTDSSTIGNEPSREQAEIERTLIEEGYELE